MPVDLDAVSEAIRCQAVRKDGRSCRSLLAERVDGVVIVKHAGRESIVSQTSCPKCGAVYRFPAIKACENAA